MKEDRQSKSSHLEKRFVGMLNIEEKVQAVLLPVLY